MVNNLSTLTSAKAYMKKTDDRDNALLQVLVGQASEMIQTYTKRDFTAVTYTDEKYDGNGDKKLYLKNFPIFSTPAVVVKLYDPYTDTDLYTYTVNLEYIVYEEEGYIHMWGGWMKGHQNFKITYKAGYTTVIESVVLACNMLTAFVFDNMRKQGIKSQRIGTFSETLKDMKGAIPDEIKGLLDLKRRTTYAYDVDE